MSPLAGLPLVRSIAPEKTQGCRCRTAFSLPFFNTTSIMAAKVSIRTLSGNRRGESWQGVFGRGKKNGLISYQNFVDDVFQVFQVERLGKVYLGPGVVC